MIVFTQKINEKIKLVRSFFILKKKLDLQFYIKIKIKIKESFEKRKKLTLFMREKKKKKKKVKNRLKKIILYIFYNRYKFPKIKLK